MNLLQKVILAPSERMMGLVSVGVVDVLLGMWSTSVFDFLSCVPVCIWRPNFFKCSSARFAVFVASSRVGRMKVELSTYRDIQWVNSVPFVFAFCPDNLPRGWFLAVLGKNL